jgi:hypothetical protein
MQEIEIRFQNCGATSLRGYALHALVAVTRKFFADGSLADDPCAWNRENDGMVANNATCQAQSMFERF